MIYFKEYAKKYNILNYILFNCEVIKTEFDYEDEVWNITYLDHTDNTKINIDYLKWFLNKPAWYN